MDIVGVTKNLFPLCTSFTLDFFQVPHCYFDSTPHEFTSNRALLGDMRQTHVPVVKDAGLCCYYQ